MNFEVQPIELNTMVQTDQNRTRIKEEILSLKEKLISDWQVFKDGLMDKLPHLLIYIIQIITNKITELLAHSSFSM